MARGNATLAKNTFGSLKNVDMIQEMRDMSALGTSNDTDDHMFLTCTVTATEVQ